MATKRKYHVVTLKVDVPYVLHDRREERYSYVLNAVQEGIDKIIDENPNSKIKILSVVPAGGSMPPNWYLVTLKGKRNG